MKKEPTKPVKVTAILIDGRINSQDGLIMLDAILYHAWFLKHAPHVFEGLGDYDERGYDVGLPLARLGNGGWAAGRGVFKSLSTKIEYVNKRPDFFAGDKTDYLAADKGVISESVGIYRAYRNASVVHTIKDCKIEFYCLGRIGKILELLNLIEGIGKKTNIGWGAVKSWSAECIENDYSLIHPVHGLMRPTPVEEIDLTGYPIRQCRVKPPYWKKINTKLCYIPKTGGDAV